MKPAGTGAALADSDPAAFEKDNILGYRFLCNQGGIDSSSKDSLRRCRCDFPQHFDDSAPIRRTGIQTLGAWMRTAEDLNVGTLFHDRLASVLGLPPQEDNCAQFREK
jgi:hypothetical protein